MKAANALARMEEISRAGDPEGGHVDADKMLCEIIRELTAKRKDAPTWAKVVDCFDKMGKWYA